MDILKTASDWAKAEILSNGFFILFGVMFVAASVGFWHIGRTDIARAFVIPTLVAGVLLLILGGGLMYGSLTTLAGFEAAYARDAAAFVASEIARADRVLAQYGTAVFKVMPLIVIVAAALVMVFHGPVWRASLVTTIAMIAVILLVDTNANARLESYRQHLSSVAAPG